MAAGDLIVTDYQYELEGLLFGALTDIAVRRGSPKGLGRPAPKTQDTPLAHRAGSVGGRDEASVRILTFEMYIHKATAAAAEAVYATVEDAWTESPVNVELHLRRPGRGHFYTVGRPRGLDKVDLFPGHIELFGEFHALQPALISVEEA